MIHGHGAQQAQQGRQQQHGQEGVLHKGKAESFQGKKGIHDAVDRFHQGFSSFPESSPAACRGRLSSMTKRAPEDVPSEEDPSGGFFSAWGI